MFRLGLEGKKEMIKRLPFLKLYAKEKNMTDLQRCNQVKDSESI